MSQQDSEVGVAALAADVVDVEMVGAVAPEEKGGAEGEGAVGGVEGEEAAAAGAPVAVQGRDVAPSGATVLALEAQLASKDAEIAALQRQVSWLAWWAREYRRCTHNLQLCVDVGVCGECGGPAGEVEGLWEGSVVGGPPSADEEWEEGIAVGRGAGEEEEEGGSEWRNLGEAGWPSAPGWGDETSGADAP